MKLFELHSQYVGELSDVIIDILYTASAEGQDNLSTQDLIDDLKSQGYFVNVKDLIDILEGNPVVKSISKDTVELDTGINSNDEEYTGQDEKDANKDTVSKLASKQIGKDF
jgi:hypothetical protein